VAVPDGRIEAVPDGTIEAAGGVLWRERGDQRDFAVIHRPKYDDWTLPKGKLDPGETHKQAAVREVAEETGYTGELGPDLGETWYQHNARPKRVRYWGMRAVGGRFEANKEVDELRWLALDAARDLLSYRRDREILDRFVTSSVSRG
jgi:8-oxo-dGTP pyrophosphatase MutT (NUDIX family)